MTVSSTRSCARAERRRVAAPRRWARRLALACLALALALLPGLTAADSLKVEAAYLDVSDEGYLLNADFDVALNPTLEDAVNRGVSLVFAVELDVKRPRWYWLPERIASARREYRLSYSALTRQYRLSQGGLSQDFGTLDEAVGLMRRLRGWLVLKPGELQPGQSYQMELRFSLDVSRLPKPMQVEALTSRDWHLEARHQLQLIQ